MTSDFDLISFLQALIVLVGVVVALIVLVGVVVAIVHEIFKSAETRAKEEAEAEAIIKRKEAEKEESLRKLGAEIDFKDSGLLITNNEKRPWHKCKLTLNVSLLRGEYSFTSKDPIPAKGSLIVRWQDFTKGDGTRFNYRTKAPKTLHMSCVVDWHGKGISRRNYFKF